MQAFCLKCRAMRGMRDLTPVVSKGGQPGAEGRCTVCGKKLFRLGYKLESEEQERQTTEERPVH